MASATERTQITPYVFVALGIGPEKEAWKCPVFLGSITMPLGVLAAEWWRQSA